jgi:plasmid stability protein
MANLLIKHVPDDLRRRLRKAAEIHQRSMNQEALMVLAGALDMLDPLPKAVQIKKPFTNAFIQNAKRG